jgi:hypothetical protein
MPISHECAQQRGRIGGLVSAALSPDLQERMRPAQAARWQRYLDRIPPEVTDPAERERRAGMLRQADMLRLSLAARRAAEARRAEAELRDALGLAAEASPDSSAA